jgi:hypothetical protein
MPRIEAAAATRRDDLVDAQLRQFDDESVDDIIVPALTSRFVANARTIGAKSAATL